MHALLSLSATLSLFSAPLAAHEHFQDMDAGEWALTIAAVLISAWAIWRSVQYALHPGETEPDHIKRSILHDDAPPPPPKPPPPATHLPASHLPEPR